jgi:hypothetical protein
MTHENNSQHNILAHLRDLVQQQRDLEDEILKLENLLEQKKRDLAQIAEKDLPQLMELNEISSFKLPDGSSVEVKPVIRAHVSKDNEVTAFDWLEDHGYGGIIKTEVITNFSRGELEAAQRLVETLRSQEMVAVLKRSVHHKTLESFAKGLLEEGIEFPLDTFGVIRQTKSTIKRPKVKE